MKNLILMLLIVFITGAVFAQSSKAVLSSTKNTTVNINNSDHDFSLIANFNPPKTERIKELVLSALGKPMENTESLSLWNLKNIYTVTLKDKKLIIDLDKDKATNSLIKTFEELGDSIQEDLSPTKTNKSRPKN